MDSKLRWGVLGAAGIAKLAVVPAIQGSRNGVVRVVGSRNPTASEAWAKEVGIPKVVGAYEAVLADPDIDAVYIPLPNSLHATWVERAAEAGKAVLCEKPLGLNAAEAEQMAERCSARGVPLMEGFMYRFHPQHRRVLQLVREGAIGELREVHAHLSVDLMNPPDAGNVRFAPALGGGALLDMGCYTVSIVRMAFGEEPEHVRGWQHVDERFGVDVSTAALLEFSGGRVALVSCSFEANGQGFYRLIGRSGLIDVPRAVIPGLGDRSAETIVIKVDANGRRTQEEIAPVNQYRLMVEAFAEAVLKRQPMPLPPFDSIANLRALDAIAVAANEGRTVHL
jgi:xylose dehydrogenase (NAD/NADP)